MKSRFTLLGAKGLKVPEAAELAGAALKIGLDLRESSYKGGEYFLHRYIDGAEISIEGNVRDEDGVLTESEFPEYSTLIYLNYSRSELEESLSDVREFDLLRSEAV
ncbi:hypothetical protein ACIHEJ_37775 [Streptomyces sp. NPDC052301]|uniref:hypothetical protein n=1 Tax=Streptomyces sp. NPDC052301 TaxID=3365687 RepID=UPI0037D358A8